jgi:hypothetical protein
MFDLLLFVDFHLFKRYVVLFLNFKFLGWISSLLFYICILVHRIKNGIFSHPSIHRIPWFSGIFQHSYLSSASPLPILVNVQFRLDVLSASRCMKDPGGHAREAEDDTWRGAP